MPRIKRRQFLQFAGSALASIGLSEFDLLQQGDRYGKVLAQSTPRKLALLVGINEYPESKRFQNLQGCLTDVELQRQLLIYRFGFNPDDIKIVTDKEATREGILTVFDEHLIKQAKSGDVVVFHFSGHGSRVADPDGISSDGLNSTFVPANDSPLAEQGIVNDIMGHTLFMLMYALKQKTENVTAVLDSCHSGGGTRGNIRVRSAEGGKNLSASPTELEYQQQLIKRLNVSPKDLAEARKLGVATGVVLASARPKDAAADYEFSGFHAGAFTYLLTQYLWQQATNVENVMNRVKNNIKLLSNQVPLYEVKPNSPNDKKPIYFVEKQVPPAEAVITQLNGNEATLWLGGIGRDSIDAFGQGATFVTLSGGGRGAATTEVEMKSRDGLFGKAIVKGSAQPGALLQEFARAIPSDWKLQIGLDPSLSAEATSAKDSLEKLGRLEAVPSQPGNKPYAKEVHYLLSRVTPAYRQELQRQQGTEIPPEGSICLFSPALELIPDSFGEPGETVVKAIARLGPKLKSLLAARVIKMTLNAESSRLNLEVKMNLVGGQSLVAQAFTPRGCEEPTSCPPYGSRGDSAQLRVGSSLQFQVINREKTPLYLGLVLIDSAEGLVVLFPNNYQKLSDEELDQATRIEPNQPRLIPDPNKDDFILTIEKAGVGEVLVIASQKPLTNALLRLQSLAKSRNKERGAIDTRGEEALNVTDDLVKDMSRGTSLIGVRSVSASQIAALSITFETV